MFISTVTLRKLCTDRIDMLNRQGFYVDGLKEKLRDISDSYDSLYGFASSLSEDLSIRSDFAYEEPNDLESIRALLPKEKILLAKTYESEVEIRNRVYGGVAGRMLGCALGKPLEVQWDLPTIRHYLEGINAWPLNDFVPAYSPNQKYHLRRDCIDSMNGFINHMQEDDDINYFVLGLHVLEKYGINFSTQDMAIIWLRNIPYYWTWGNEHLLYMRLACYTLDRTVSLPTGKEWDKFMSFLSTKDEHIGAMIRGDTFGLVNPANIELAAEMAWRDGRLTHGKTGLYAEMWVAAVISAAFNTNDPVVAIKAGLAQIPETSRYAECIRLSLDIALSESDWLKAWEKIDKYWGHLGHAGTFNETGAIINALVHSVDRSGNLDFEKVICTTVMHGWDTDCSGATAGCIAGVMCGYNKLPQKWTSKLNNTFYTSVASERERNIEVFAERMYNMSYLVRSCCKYGLSKTSS